MATINDTTTTTNNPDSPQSPISPQSPPTIRHHNNLSITMNNGTNIPRSALSPVGSVAGSDWSGISKYTSPERDLMFGGAPPPYRPPANISPPSSIARSSDGTGAYASGEGGATLKNIALEEQVSLHHSALSKWLREFLETKGSIRPNRARDKLLRLSVIQFQELSTDVYDELQRREPGAITEVLEDADTPPYLPPKQDFHPKRNQARQKLSTLPADRFRDLATDVFYELERRFPKFSSGLLPSIHSPTNSMDGRGIQPPGRVGSPGMPPRMGSPGPMGPGRRGSPGPGMMGRGGPYQQGPGGSNNYRGPPPRGMPGGPPGTPRGPGPGQMGHGPDSFGRPLPKTFQSNTIIPNKSTMVEDDDGDDDDDMDAFGLEDRNANGQTRRSNGPGRRDSARSTSSRNGSEVDKKLISDYQNKVEILQDKVAGLEASLDEREEELRVLKVTTKREEGSHNSQGEWEEIRIGLEGKLADAENLNSNIRSELERVKEESAASERLLQEQLKEQQEQFVKQQEELREQIQEQQTQLHDQQEQFHEQQERMKEQQEELERLRSRGPSVLGGSGGVDNGQYQALLREHEELKQDLHEQEEVTEEVRREAMEFLNQMKVISERADNSFEREERQNGQIQKLQGEVAEWKARYAKAKTTIRSIRSSSLGLQVPTSGGLFGKEGNLVDPRGLVKAVHLTKFQIAIDELLKVARSINFAQSLELVKQVVVATRALTRDVDRDQDPAVARMRGRVSATANNLTTAAKNHATGCGLSPVSLLDAAASHLTASVIELVKLVRIRPTQEGESDDEDEYAPSTSHDEPIRFSPVDNNSRVVPELDVSGSEQRMSAESLYSSFSSPRGSRSRDGSALLGQTVGSESKNWDERHVVIGSDVEELRLFLENQTNEIVESIQSLLESIKSDATVRELSQQIGVISEVVERVLGVTEGAMKNEILRERGEWIVANLGGCRDRMLGMRASWGDEGEARVQKEAKGKLAGLAFDIARETKELVRTVEDIDNQARRRAGVEL